MKKQKQNKKSRRKTRLGLFLFVLVIAFAVSTGTSYFYLKEKFAFESAFIADIEARQDKAGAQGQKQDSARLYGADEHEHDSEDSSVLRKDTLLVVAEDVIRKYVKSYKARLIDLYLDKKGIMYIDFGDGLKRNFNVDAGEELEFIAGLYNSLKATVPGFTAIKFLIEGEEAESFGGHIDISRPIGEEIASSS